MQARSLLSGPALAVLTVLIGCDSPTGPSNTAQWPIDEFSMQVYTEEGDANRHILTVGQEGIAVIRAWGRATCGASPYTVPCPVALDAEFRSSDPNVVGPGSKTISGFGEMTFVAKAPGSVVLTAQVYNRIDSARVDVVASPLPLDSIRVRRMPSAFDSVLAVATDAAGNIDSLTFTPLSGALLRILSFRDGDSTVYLPVTRFSSDVTVAAPSLWCREDLLECDIPRPVWVGANSPGTATITVEARGAQYSFKVRVVNN